MEQSFKLPNGVLASIVYWRTTNPLETIHRLSWGSGFLGVDDEFTEYYQNLPLALMRLATLSYAVDREQGFANEPLRFSTNASQFLIKEVN